jgi:hypothetical protein
LPDGLFSNQKYRFGQNFQGLRLENVDMYIPCPFGIFYGYFVTIRYILCSFGTFFPVLVLYTTENLATLLPNPNRCGLLNILNHIICPMLLLLLPPLGLNNASSVFAEKKLLK